MRIHTKMNDYKWVSIWLKWETMWYNDSSRRDILKSVKRKQKKDGQKKTVVGP